jgi:hypothetical protein
MSNYKIEWDRTRLQWTKRADLAPWSWQATLTQETWLGGQRRTRVICAVARIIEERVDDPAEREHFWTAARRKLGRLTRLDDRDRWQIEAELKRKVPLPMPQARSATTDLAAS